MKERKKERRGEGARERQTGKKERREGREELDKLSHNTSYLMVMSHNTSYLMLMLSHNTSYLMVMSNEPLNSWLASRENVTQVTPFECAFSNLRRH